MEGDEHRDGHGKWDRHGDGNEDRNQALSLCYIPLGFCDSTEAKQGMVNPLSICYGDWSSLVD